PLLPEDAQNGLSANEAGNSILLTAPQSDVHRMAEIIAALDTAVQNVSQIKVFTLKYADAKALVDSVKELFTPPQQQNQGPGGGRGGFGGGNTARGNTSATAARVVAVADERSNSLIVAAVPDAMPEIERL